MIFSPLIEYLIKMPYRGDKRQRENSTDEDGGEVQENDWDENYECDSNISYFEDEMDRLLDP